MYAVVKTIEEANLLNNYIGARYYIEVPGANFEQWTEIIPVENGYALEVMEEWVDYPVPEFIVNGIVYREVFLESLNIIPEGINQ